MTKAEKAKLKEEISKHIETYSKGNRSVEPAFYVVAGELNPDFYKGLVDDVLLPSIKKCEDLKINILAGPLLMTRQKVAEITDASVAHPVFKLQSERKKSENTKIYLTQPTERIPYHFGYVDGSEKAWIEMPHEEMLRPLKGIVGLSERSKKEKLMVRLFDELVSSYGPRSVKVGKSDGMCYQVEADGQKVKIPFNKVFQHLDKRTERTKDWINFKGRLREGANAFTMFLGAKNYLPRRFYYIYGSDAGLRKLHDQISLMEERTKFELFKNIFQAIPIKTRGLAKFPEVPLQIENILKI